MNKQIGVLLLLGMVWNGLVRAQEPMPATVVKTKLDSFNFALLEKLNSSEAAVRKTALKLLEPSLQHAYSLSQMPFKVDHRQYFGVDNKRVLRKLVSLLGHSDNEVVEVAATW